VQEREILEYQATRGANINHHLILISSEQWHDENLVPLPYPSGSRHVKPHSLVSFS
jgi:hypothetical protein